MEVYNKPIKQNDRGSSKSAKPRAGKPSRAQGKPAQLLFPILRKNGHEIIQARSGEAAIDLAAQTLPDLILLDIQLPGMDGYTVAQELRKNPGLAGIPIIAVTSYAMTGDRERILAAGCTSYLEKPINPDTFHREITEFL